MSEYGEIHESHVYTHARTHTRTYTHTVTTLDDYLPTLDEAILCYDSERGLTLDKMIVLCIFCSGIAEESWLFSAE